MNQKVKNAGYHLFHYLIAAGIFCLHAFVLSPALWHHQSSAAFDMNLIIWIIVVVWWIFLLLAPLLAVRRFWRKLRRATT